MGRGARPRCSVSSLICRPHLLPPALPVQLMPGAHFPDPESELVDFLGTLLFRSGNGPSAVSSRTHRRDFQAAFDGVDAMFDEMMRDMSTRRSKTPHNSRHYMVETLNQFCVSHDVSASPRCLSSVVAFVLFLLLSLSPFPPGGSGLA